MQNIGRLIFNTYHLITLPLLQKCSNSSSHSNLIPVTSARSKSSCSEKNPCYCIFQTPYLLPDASRCGSHKCFSQSLSFLPPRVSLPLLQASAAGKMQTVANLKALSEISPRWQSAEKAPSCEELFISLLHLGIEHQKKQDSYADLAAFRCKDRLP